MSQNVHFIGFTLEEARQFITEIVKDCLEKNAKPIKPSGETILTVKEACKFFGVSAPTLRKFVKSSIIRRHDLGPRKKVFYLSELEEDLKKLKL